MECQKATRLRHSMLFLVGFTQKKRQHHREHKECNTYSKDHRLRQTCHACSPVVSRFCKRVVLSLHESYFPVCHSIWLWLWLTAKGLGHHAACPTHPQRCTMENLGGQMAAPENSHPLSGRPKSPRHRLSHNGALLMNNPDYSAHFP